MLLFSPTSGHAPHAVMFFTLKKTPTVVKRQLFTNNTILLIGGHIVHKCLEI